MAEELLNYDSNITFGAVSSLNGSLNSAIGDGNANYSDKTEFTNVKVTKKGTYGKRSPYVGKIESTNSDIDGTINLTNKNRDVDVNNINRFSSSNVDLNSTVNTNLISNDSELKRKPINIPIQENSQINYTQTVYNSDIEFKKGQGGKFSFLEPDKNIISDNIYNYNIDNMTQPAADKYSGKITKSTSANIVEKAAKAKAGGWGQKVKKAGKFGIGAVVVGGVLANMMGNSGKQSNSQLYGQQPIY